MCMIKQRTLNKLREAHSVFQSFETLVNGSESLCSILTVLLRSNQHQTPHFSFISFILLTLITMSASSCLRDSRRWCALIKICFFPLSIRWQSIVLLTRLRLTVALALTVLWTPQTWKAFFAEATAVSTSSLLLNATLFLLTVKSLIAKVRYQEKGWM